ncbi:hypothetical protein K402DRAFT_329716, partial [Aulographum hederae CBS 113979]
MIRNLLLWSLVAARTLANPRVAFPFNSQVPPLARVGENYAFSFSPTTFVQNPQELDFSLVGAPSWLALDGKTRTLWGKPGESDTGPAQFHIIASDPSGSTTMDATLIVVSSPPPEVAIDVSAQLPSMGKLTGRTSLTMPPLKEFELAFSPETFVKSQGDLYYYSTLADRTPLPGWLSFDPNQLKYSGMTPKLSASPQTFEVLLIASHVSGFADMALPFKIEVSVHSFFFSPCEQDIAVDPGSSVSVTHLHGQLMLDGNSINDEDLVNATAEIPPWLEFDPRTFAITGTAPAGVPSQDVTVTVFDHFGDSANMTVHLKFLSLIFKGEVGTLNATIGQPFNYSISPSLVAEKDVLISVDLGTASSWLQFNPETLSIHGTVPGDLQPTTMTAKMTVAVPSSDLSDSQQFQIKVASPRPVQPTSTDLATRAMNPNASSTAPGESPGESAADSTTSDESGKKTAGIVAAVVIPIVVIVAILVLLAMYGKLPGCARRNHKRKH